MKTIAFNKANAGSFAGTLRKLAISNGSMVFPGKGIQRPGGKFGNLRKESSTNPQKLTTCQVKISVDDEGISIINPLNKGYGYSNITIPFGKVVRMSNSFIWFDEWGIWRQLRFDKSPGWALCLSGGRMKPHIV